MCGAQRKPKYGLPKTYRIVERKLTKMQGNSLPSLCLPKSGIETHKDQRSFFPPQTEGKFYLILFS